MKTGTTTKENKGEGEGFKVNIKDVCAYVYTRMSEC